MSHKPAHPDIMMEVAHLAVFHHTFLQFDHALKWAQECAEEAHNEARSEYHRSYAARDYDRAWDRVEQEFRKMEVLSQLWGIDMTPITAAFLGKTEEN